MFDVTYKQEHGPSAIPFNAYADRTLRDYRSLLDSDPSEDILQDFLEHRPSLVPGAWTPGTRSGHTPFYNALIAQPRLPGFNARVPDFLWLSHHSGTIYAALVEIERPSKHLFTAAPIPTAEYTQAYNQFAEWRIWFDSPANKQSFFDHYGIEARQLFSLDFDLHLILVFGRRSEFVDVPRLSKLRSKLAKGRNEELVSFDRLSPDPLLHSALTVSPAGGGRFVVKCVPETFTLSPYFAHDLLPLDRLEAAIDENRNIAPARRTFLKRRLEYWLQWARRADSRCIQGDAFYE